MLEGFVGFHSAFPALTQAARQPAPALVSAVERMDDLSVVALPDRVQLGARGHD